MAIKHFTDFVSSNIINESSERKTKIAKFLDNVRGNVDSMMRERDYLKRPIIDSDPKKAMGGLFKGILKLGAFASDVVFGSHGKKKENDEDVSNLKPIKYRSYKEDGATEADASNFYLAGIIRGKRIFGNDFDANKPRNKQEQEYVDALNSSTEKYYNKIYRSR
jgi:hypothetical protein